MRDTNKTFQLLHGISTETLLRKKTSPDNYKKSTLSFFSCLPNSITFFTRLNFYLDSTSVIATATDGSADFLRSIPI